MKNKIVLSLIGRARRYRVKRTYKDRLFRVIFREKKAMLSLYNAINGTEHENLEDLEVRTLEDAVYLGYKNDLSFLISNTLNLYEHQSTTNPNMPLRGLIYFAEMLRAYVEEGDYDLYGSKLISLPVPQYIVFYNGLENKPDREELRLSDAFDEKARSETALECKAIVLNINKGHNAGLMEKCRQLEGYSYFIDAVREYLGAGYDLESAVDQAIDECVSKDKIADILVKNRAEVKNMFLTDFDEKKYRKILARDAKEEGRTEGRIEGRIEGRREGRKEGQEAGRMESRGIINELTKRLIQEGRMEDLKRSLDDHAYQDQMLKEYGLEYTDKEME